MYLIYAFITGVMYLIYFSDLPGRLVHPAAVFSRGQQELTESLQNTHLHIVLASYAFTVFVRSVLIQGMFSLTSSRIHVAASELHRCYRW